VNAHPAKARRTPIQSVFCTHSKEIHQTTLPIMTIRYISSSKAQTSTRSPSTSRNPKQSPDPETSLHRSPRRNQKRHQRIPSQPIQLSNSNSLRPNHQPIKTAPFPLPQSSRRPKRGAPSTAEKPALSTSRHPSHSL